MYSPEFLALQEVVAGRYSLIRELGRGGMGVVFLARDVALERPVAIKMLPPVLADDAAHRARFVREAKTAAALAHPNIVPIHSVEEHARVVFFVMGFVDGETLADRVSRCGPLPTQQLIRVMQEVSWALAHAHAHGVIHRDVKPENVLLESGTDRAIVTDFGIAWVNDATATTGRGKIVGTPRYMSPEQASGEMLDGRSDVYSLGAVAYFAATGRPPIDAPTTPAIFSKLLTEAPAPVASRRGSIPARVASAIDRCLAKSPDARWASAEVLAATLRSTGNASSEIAPPIKTYLRDSNAALAEMGTGLTSAATSLLMLLVSVTLMPMNDLGAHLTKIFSVVLFLGTAASMTGLAGWRYARLVADTRKLLRAGYGNTAVSAALAIDDVAALDEPVTRPTTKSALVGTLAGIAISAASLFLMRTDGTPTILIGMAGSIVAPAMTLKHLLRSVSNNDRWWSRLMRGAFGRSTFRLAGVRMPEVRALPSAGDPTSIALGTALGNLFDALPPERRKQFRELPGLVARLEAAAAELRRRTPTPDADARSGLIVSALESLRLDLLRLHAQSGSADDLTHDLEAAARIGDDIAAQLDERGFSITPDGFTPQPG